MGMLETSCLHWHRSALADLILVRVPPSAGWWPSSRWGNQLSNQGFVSEEHQVSGRSGTAGGHINGGGVWKGQKQLSEQKPLLGEMRKRKPTSLGLSVAACSGGNDIWKLRPGRQPGWNSAVLGGNGSCSSLGDVIWAKNRDPIPVR